jgi:Tfp pilus assembly protein PilN
MLEIDFLPAQYRRRKARQQSKPWQAIVVSAMVVLVAVAAVGQYRELGSLRAELARIEPQYEQTVAMSNHLSLLQEELKHARAEAALLTYLRHPWPRTQLLRALLEPLPDAIVLTELEISNELPAVPGTRQRSRLQPDDDSKATATIAPAERDLADLRQRSDFVHTVLRVSGATNDSAALHRYLGSLARSSLFRKAELESIESTENQDGRGVRFRATVVVRPGYGQPGGPTGPKNEAIARRIGP